MICPFRTDTHITKLKDEYDCGNDKVKTELIKTESFPNCVGKICPFYSCRVNEFKVYDERCLKAEKIRKGVV